MNRLLFFLTLPLLIVSCSGGYTITGSVPEGIDSIILQIKDTSEVVYDVLSVTSKEKFTFTGKLDEMSQAILLMKSGDDVKKFITFSMYNEKIVLLSDSTSRGGLIAVKNDNKIGKLTKIIDSSESDDTPFLVIDSLLTLNPADSLVPFIFHSYSYAISLKQYESIMAKIDPSKVDNIYFVYSQPHFECLRKTDVGQPFVDFTCLASDGKPLQLSSFAGKGKWLLVDFWASWCGPCRRENPNVVAAYRKYHDKGFEIIGVSLDSNPNEWAKAIEMDSLTWTHVSDLKQWNTQSRKVYGIMSIPSNILIAPDGTIAARDLRGSKLDEFLSENLK